MISEGEIFPGLYVTIHHENDEEKPYNDDPYAAMLGMRSNKKDLSHLMGVPLKVTGVNLPYVVCVYQAIIPYTSLFGGNSSTLGTGHIVLDTRKVKLMEVEESYLRGYAEALLTKSLFPADTGDNKPVAL